MKNKLTFALALLAATSAHAGIILSVEAVGMQQTSLSRTITETFNLFSTGDLGLYTSPIGQYSSGAVISDPNAWGGAGQTRYIAVGAQSNTTSYTLTFNGDQTYFGFNWQAADAKNELRFYNDGNLVRTTTTEEVFGPLSAAYFGNPNNGQNTHEKFAFVNFTATQGTVFDQVMFYNLDTSTGFETDSHTILRPFAPRKTVVTSEAPEPATIALVGAALITAALKRRS